MSIQTASNLETPLCAQASDRKLNSDLGFPMYVPLAHYRPNPFAAAIVEPTTWVVPGFGSDFVLTAANVAFETAGSAGSGTTVATIAIRVKDFANLDPIIATLDLTAAERVALTVDSTTPQGGRLIPLTETGKTLNIAGRRLYATLAIGSGTPVAVEPDGTYLTLVIQPSNPQNQ